MKITLEIDEHRIEEFFKLIQPLSYISKSEVDWYDSLSAEQKASVEKGLADVDLNNVLGDDEVRYGIRKKIDKAKE